MAILENEILWRQFGAAIDMLGNAMRDCPDELWEKRMWDDEQDQQAAAEFSAFWYIAFHTLFWLDRYISGAKEGFAPPAPFDLTEMDPDGVLPRTYTRAELLGYLDFCRRKCQDTINALTDEQAHRSCQLGWWEPTFVELQLYNLRHVQEHGAQLQMFLGQQAGRPAKWVAWAK